MTYIEKSIKTISVLFRQFLYSTCYFIEIKVKRLLNFFVCYSIKLLMTVINNPSLISENTNKHITNVLKAGFFILSILP